MKYINYFTLHKVRDVALYTSAWIEIGSSTSSSHPSEVALYTSAWIEMIAVLSTRLLLCVALYTSAWIEISCGAGT